MANEENLIPFNKRTESEQREITSKGGKKSGESRRNKKLLKDYMDAVLELPVTSNKQFNNLSKMGIPVENIDNKMLLVVSLFKRATIGDVSAFKEIRSLIGEETAPNEEQLRKLDDVLDKLGGDI